MGIEADHPTKKWTVSILALISEDGAAFKVTRRLHELHVSETRMFDNKEEAKMQFIEWLE